MPKSKAKWSRVFPLPEGVPAGCVVIRDLANTAGTMSVTNDAEAVVRDLVAAGQLSPNGQRLFYFDCDEVLDELVVANGEFVGFQPGPREKQMKTTFTILRADGTSEKREVEWPQQPGYDRIREVVDAVIDGPLEHVSVLHDGKPTDMFVDELGHVRTTGPKPLNEAATKIYRAWSVSKGHAEADLPTIVGDVVVFDRRVWF